MIKRDQTAITKDFFIGAVSIISKGFKQSASVIYELLLCVEVPFLNVFTILVCTTANFNLVLWVMRKNISEKNYFYEPGVGQYL